MQNYNKELDEKEILEFINKRFQDIKKQNKIKELVVFQTINKYLIMAHNQEQLQVLGRIVASNKKEKFSNILNEYEMNLKTALDCKPTIKTHSNVIMHIFGFFSKEFGNLEKKKFFELLENYKEEKITIGNILAEIHPIVYRYNKTYLASQTYFLLYANSEKGNIFKMLESGKNK
ncbi:MAG TPA: YbgA family protein [Nitrosopumilus sp.]|jgi:uncharacterized protein YbgA (DUF1722 family)|nr:YbgA family protein [Nitrosopumilus sp.]